jgi:ribosome-binding factor A
MSLRIEKINKELQRQIMGIIQKEVDDPDLEMLSITRVDTTLDLSESRIFYSLLNDAKFDKAQTALNKMASFIRFQLSKKINLRILPKLKFIADDTIKYSVDICKKIDEVTQGDKRNAENKIDE